MLNITFRQLRALATVCRTGKVHSAAERLGLTAPAVTLQLKELESQLGVTLFDRTAKALFPNDMARLVARVSEDFDVRLRDLEDEINAMRHARKGSLRLGAVSTAKYFVPSMIAVFKAQHPEINIEMRVGNRAQILDHLRHHEVDISIMGSPPHDIPVRSIVIGNHPLVIIAPPYHPLASVREIQRERLQTETFLLRENGSGSRRMFESLFVDVPGGPERPGMEMGSNESIKQAVMAGLGIALISAHTITQELKAGRLVVLDVVGMPIMRQWFCVTHAMRAETPTKAAFLEFINQDGPKMLSELFQV
ncbi:MAG: LysR family transcriptional regulator [Alphaproteobacteria bacterium]|nr:LysR family transcriptional regulator [Alphaproteobacteria bacterium]MDE2042379.1 LysR family transcriptional regulator [Alphaproteobacteria bacterium]MDE2341276.1 LysR family transcriptional regulator [Alphaproteobacteria bacterium]